MQLQPNMDWMLKELAESVPGTRHVIVLTSDGLRMAQHNTDVDTADRLAAACAGLQSLSVAVASEFPHGDRRMRLVVIEIGGGFFYLMAAGPGAYLAVLADEGVDAGLMGQQMRSLVARIGEHLTSPPRAGREQRRVSGPPNASPAGPAAPGPASWAHAGPERLYVITGGRGGAAARRADLDLVTLVVARTAVRPELQPEHTAILRMCAYPLSMAEISAYLKLPFSVVAVLVSDLIADQHVEVRTAVRASGGLDPELLKAVMYGLQRL